jgi:predicted DsbA family dithiol-disulfide isomerase
VEEFTDVICPFCGQTCEIVIDTSLAQQRFNTDCEICCRPFEVSAECKSGSIVRVEVAAD